MPRRTKELLARQIETKARLRVAAELEKKAKIRKAIEQLDLLRIEMARLSARKRELERVIADEMKAKEARIQKIARTEAKKANLCPACQGLHTSEVPDKCWLEVHRIGYASELAKAFDDYLKKNDFGKLFD